MDNQDLAQNLVKFMLLGSAGIVVLGAFITSVFPNNTAQSQAPDEAETAKSKATTIADKEKFINQHKGIVCEKCKKRTVSKEEALMVLHDERFDGFVYCEDCRS